MRRSVTYVRRRVAALVRCTAGLAVLFLLVVGCSSSDVSVGERSVAGGPSAASDLLSDDGTIVTSSGIDPDDSATASAEPIVCENGDVGESFTVPLQLQIGMSLDLIVEITDQAGTEGAEDVVRSWPVTVTVRDLVDNAWLITWDADRSALDLPVGFSTSDVNDLREQRLPPMPEVAYRVSAQGDFLAMKLPRDFGNEVATAVRAAATSQGESVQESLLTLSDLYRDAPSAMFEIAATEAEIFHEFATASFTAEPTVAAGPARASAFLLEPVTTEITTQVAPSLAARGCVAVTKQWVITPEERGQDAGRPILEGVYTALFDSMTGQPAEITQVVTLVRQGDDDRGPRSFTTKLTIVRPWS